MSRERQETWAPWSLPAWRPKLHPGDRILTSNGNAVHIAEWTGHFLSIEMQPTPPGCMPPEQPPPDWFKWWMDLPELPK